MRVLHREERNEGVGPCILQKLQDQRLLTAAGLLSVALEPAGTEALVGAWHVEALGVGGADGGQPALVDVRTLPQGVACEPWGTPALIRPRGVHTGGRRPTGERPVGDVEEARQEGGDEALVQDVGRGGLHVEGRGEFLLVTQAGRVDTFVNILC